MEDQSVEYDTNTKLESDTIVKELEVAMSELIDSYVQDMTDLDSPRHTAYGDIERVVSVASLLP